MKLNLHIPVSEKELKEAISQMRILIDTREQKNDHIIAYFNAKKIPFEFRKLEYGDYSCILPAKAHWFNKELPVIPNEISLEQFAVIERKHSIDEIATNIGKDSERFERELIRIKAANAKAVLLLENFSFERVLKGLGNGDYRSTMDPKQIILRINGLCIRYGIMPITLDSRDFSGLMIQSLLARFAYEFLKE